MVEMADVGGICAGQSQASVCTCIHCSSIHTYIHCIHTLQSCQRTHTTTPILLARTIEGLGQRWRQHSSGLMTLLGPPCNANI